MNAERQDKVALTTELVTELRDERDRTSVGPQALLKPYEDVPKGLNHAMVTHWLGGRISTAKREHLEFVRAAWAERKTSRSITITEDMYAELNELQTKSGVNAEMMMRWAGASSVGLSVSKIKHILSGKAKSIKTDQLEYMKRVWNEKV